MLRRRELTTEKTKLFVCHNIAELNMVAIPLNKEASSRRAVRIQSKRCQNNTCTHSSGLYKHVLMSVEPVFLYYCAVHRSCCATILSNEINCIIP
uniref:Uncharacterized protein n=1 Tax=Parascaris univalens TaxID=6257 RepID=A0A915BAP5_PARUN